MFFTHTEAFFLGKISPPRQKSLCTCLYHYMCYSQSSLLSYLHIFATILESEGVNLSVYLTLCHPMDCSLPVSSVHEIFKARILEWVAIPFSRGLPDPEIEPNSPYCGQILYCLSYQGTVSGLKVGIITYLILYLWYLAQFLT